MAVTRPTRDKKETPQNPKNNDVDISNNTMYAAPPAPENQAQFKEDLPKEHLTEPRERLTPVQEGQLDIKTDNVKRGLYETDSRIREYNTTDMTLRGTGPQCLDNVPTPIASSHKALTTFQQVNSNTPVPKADLNQTLNVTDLAADLANKSGNNIENYTYSFTTFEYTDPDTDKTINLCASPIRGCTELTPAHWATISGNQTALEEMLEQKPELATTCTHPAFKKNSNSKEGALPIDYASALGNDEMVAFLKEKGSRDPSPSIVSQISAPSLISPNEKQQQQEIEEEAKRKQQQNPQQEAVPSEDTQTPSKSSYSEISDTIKKNPEYNYRHSDEPVPTDRYTDPKHKTENMVVHPKGQAPITSRQPKDSPYKCEPSTNGVTVHFDEKGQDHTIEIGRENGKPHIDVSNFHPEKADFKTTLRVSGGAMKVTFGDGGKITMQSCSEGLDPSKVTFQIDENTKATFNEKGELTTTDGKPLIHNGKGYEVQQQSELDIDLGDVTQTLQNAGVTQSEPDSPPTPTPMNKEAMKDLEGASRC